MQVFLEEVYFIGVSARHKGVELTDCPYEMATETGEAWLLGFHNADKLPSYKQAVETGINDNSSRG